jgi:asparagine synthase (glutamine-hydrolysing)
MTKTMQRRGPDAGGVWIDRHVGLGHRRLAVIDLAGGVQPKTRRNAGYDPFY